MAGLKNKLGLSIETPNTHKKYLGEADDLHYIPDSPHISRQIFTEQEEGELKRLCALALARIPHSDDMSDDPFKYLAAAVITAPEPTPAKLPTDPIPQPQSRPTTKPAFVPDRIDSATPSDGSERGASGMFDRTDYSTPLTSAGITPGETIKRFSDAAKRQSNSKETGRAKDQTSRSRVTSSHAPPRKSADATNKHERKPSKDTTTSRAQHSIKLVQQTPRQSDADSHSQRLDNVRPLRFSQLELNKKLPALPRSITDPSPIEKPTTGFFKNIKKKRSIILEGRSLSTSATSSPVAPAISKFNVQRHSAAPTPQAVQAVAGEQKRSRFKFGKLFGRSREAVPLAVS